MSRRVITTATARLIDDDNPDERSTDHTTDDGDNYQSSYRVLIQPTLRTRILTSNLKFTKYLFLITPFRPAHSRARCSRGRFSKKGSDSLQSWGRWKVVRRSRYSTIVTPLPGTSWLCNSHFLDGSYRIWERPSPLPVIKKLNYPR